MPLRNTYAAISVSLSRTRARRRDVDGARARRSADAVTATDRCRVDVSTAYGVTYVITAHGTTLFEAAVVAGGKCARRAGPARHRPTLCSALGSNLRSSSTTCRCRRCCHASRERVHVRGRYTERSVN